MPRIWNACCFAQNLRRSKRGFRGKLVDKLEDTANFSSVNSAEIPPQTDFSCIGERSDAKSHVRRHQMARVKPMLAISLALALLISPIPSAFADGPPLLNGSGGTKDGHPWDDESQETDPGLNPNPLAQQPINVETPSTAAVAYVPNSSGASFVSGVIRFALQSWNRFTEVRSAQRKAVGMKNRR
jgi:hypothetical protein